MTIGLVAMLAAATFLLWNRIPGPRPVRLAGRAVLLVSGQFATIVALLVSLNIAYGGLVVSWGDLLGNQTTDGAHMTGTSGKVTMNPVAKVTKRTLSTSQKFTSAGDGYIKTTLKGTKSGVTSTVYVYLPKSYAKNPTKAYPVVELIHGVPDSPGAWMKQMHAAKRMEAAAATGSSEFILVIPEATPYASHSSMDDSEECTDVSSTDKIQTWLTQDVRHMVIDNFRAIDSASGWGLMGYSTGGFCAADLVLKYPNLYKAAVSISGYYSPESREVTSDAARSREDDPTYMVQHATTPAVSLLMTASAQDPVDPPSEPAAFLKAVQGSRTASATEVKQYIAPLGGGHNQSAWEKMLPTSYRFLSDRLSTPVTWS